MAVSRAQLLKVLTPALSKMFSEEYDKYMAPQYKMKPLYGKYAIYKTEYKTKGAVTTTLARGLDKDTAEGMMKLLENHDEQ